MYRIYWFLTTTLINMKDTFISFVNFSFVFWNVRSQNIFHEVSETLPLFVCGFLQNHAIFTWFEAAYNK